MPRGMNLLLRVILCMLCLVPVLMSAQQIKVADFARLRKPFLRPRLAERIMQRGGRPGVAGRSAGRQDTMHIASHACFQTLCH